MKYEKNPQYKITLSQNQARVMMIALESFFRTRLGQFFDLADDIAFNGYDPDSRDKEGADNDFLHRINYRNDAEEMFNYAYEMAKPKYNRADDYYTKTPDMRNAIDMWHVIRHQFWGENPNRRNDTTDAYPPFPTCDEELIKIERIDEDATSC